MEKLFCNCLVNKSSRRGPENDFKTLARDPPLGLERILSGASELPTLHSESKALVEGDRAQRIEHFDIESGAIESHEIPLQRPFGRFLPPSILIEDLHAFDWSIS